ncbi:glycosyltransferase [Rhodococcus tibetensis]|uniref:Glycosyltransferase family 2 protein n=1 Tax=Rhodococcus tibetensis TaxID=2965064 RepID=A0ABT1QGQ0_9NOCA|nr:glycosyltransferase family 2 protein [Rhodococcus sp. FXJ9.536]MCQ4120960.1 glycosyltransferase family 2 protein [Rhodococcus sp. FXJ9.536]
MVSSNPDPLVSIVIVTYNSAAVIESCLAPLSDRDDIELIVFDNASSDTTADVVRAASPQATLITSDDNLGFAGGVNAAAGASTGKAILLLNPDAVISAESVLDLFRSMESDTRIGIVAPVLHRPGQHLHVREGGHVPNLWRVFCHYTGVSRLSHRFRIFEGAYLLHKHALTTREVGWVSGACMMVRSSTWRKLGGMSERWFMYAEDVELCLRVRDTGQKVIMNAEVFGTHALGGSSGDAERTEPGTAWIENLYDLYRWKIASTRLASISWKATVASGFGVRALAYRVRSRLKPATRDSSLVEAKRAQIFARTVLRQNSRLVRTGAAEGVSSR